MEYRKLSSRKLCAVAAAFVMLCPAGSAIGDDGVLEINQACAAVGCDPFDSVAGFPVTINDPGSYVLTSNLTVTSDNPAIRISANGVTLDLNGFSVVGPDSGGANGIEAIGAMSNVIIRNGVIRDFGGRGVSIASSSANWECEALHVASNGGAGIALVGSGSGFVVRNSHVIDNGSNGIWLPDNAVIAGSTIRNNGGIGVNLNIGGLVQGNEVSNNSGDGIQVARASVLHNTVTSNGEYGIEPLLDTLIHGNTVVSNNTSAGDFENIADCFSCTLGTNHAP